MNIQPRYNEGELETVLISLVDIKQRVIAEQQLRASNVEKEALLKEIHHRVKNNLQIISSLLNLQSSQLKDPEIVDIFRESQNRVRAMALIHEKLYRSDNLASISFDEYIHDLGHSLLQVYKKENKRIQLTIQADPIALDIEKAIPCGLIVNELITNSLKHGFADQKLGEPEKEDWIKIELTSISNNRVHLCVSDNGPGFAPQVDLYRTKTLGLQLVNSLVRQLEGNLVFGNQAGARIEIEFTK
jgi:two-component sensor histidine kinase